MHIKSNIALWAIVALTAMMASCTQSSKSGRAITTTSTTSTNVAVMACDASFENIMRQEIDVFEFINPKQSILPMYIDEASAVDSLMKGRAGVAVLSRELSNAEVKVLTGRGRAPHQTCIAIDAIALIVNKDNKVNELTTTEVQDILNGTYTKWRDIQPSDLGDIKVVFDHQGSSTVRFMRDSLLNGETLKGNVFAQGDNRQVFEAVKNNPDAIGIIGVSWISSDMKGNDRTTEQRAATLEQNDTTQLDFSSDIKVLRIRRPDEFDSHQPYQAYILGGTYPLVRKIYMVNTAPAGTAGHNFYVFVTSWRGQKLIQGTGVLPAVMRPRVVNLE